MARKMSAMTDALSDTASDLHRLGIKSDETYKTITIHHLGEQMVPAEAPYCKPAYKLHG